MACRKFEHWIALYVEGDLSPAERHRVDLHIRGCSDCWDFVEDLKESQSIFKSIRQNVPDQAMLLNVRAHVLAEASTQQSWFERFLWGGLMQKASLAAIAIFVVVLGGLWLSRETGTARQPVAVIAPSPVVPVTVIKTPTPDLVAPKPRVRRYKAAPLVEAPDRPVKQVAIKLLTDDPNVIIYWLVDEKGD